MGKRTFGETLRSLRERKKMSVKTVIEELRRYGQDITDKTLYSYENDKRAASADMLLALCQIYECNNILEAFAGIKPDYSIPDDFEWKLIEKYRDLDDHGKEMVDFVLDREHKRSVFEAEKAEHDNKVIQMPQHVQPNAAHESNGDYDEEDRLNDENMLD